MNTLFLILGLVLGMYINASINIFIEKFLREYMLNNFDKIKDGIDENPKSTLAPKISKFQQRLNDAMEKAKQNRS